VEGAASARAEKRVRARTVNFISKSGVIGGSNDFEMYEDRVLDGSGEELLVTMICYWETSSLLSSCST
jgi:hypothetical protein